MSLRTLCSRLPVAALKILGCSYSHLPNVFEFVASPPPPPPHTHTHTTAHTHPHPHPHATPTPTPHNMTILGQNSRVGASSLYDVSLYLPPSCIEDLLPGVPTTNALHLLWLLTGNCLLLPIDHFWRHQ